MSDEWQAKKVHEVAVFRARLASPRGIHKSYLQIKLLIK
jgi:hypothetical protein